jgi:hypothetical protein
LLRTCTIRSGRRRWAAKGRRCRRNPLRGCQRARASVHNQEWEKELGSKREAMPPKSSKGLPASSIRTRIQRRQPVPPPSVTYRVYGKRFLSLAFIILFVDFPFKTLLPLSIRSVFGCAHKLCTHRCLLIIDARARTHVDKLLFSHTCMWTNVCPHVCGQTFVHIHVFVLSHDQVLQMDLTGFTVCIDLKLFVCTDASLHLHAFRQCLPLIAFPFRVRFF